MTKLEESEICLRKSSSEIQTSIVSPDNIEAPKFDGKYVTVKNLSDGNLLEHLEMVYGVQNLQQIYRCS